jgi:hypothetical protein
VRTKARFGNDRGAATVSATADPGVAPLFFLIDPTNQLIPSTAANPTTAIHFFMPGGMLLARKGSFTR